MTHDYVYDQGFAEERARLSAMESLWDPGSRSLLDELGIGDGWRCLEVGAGGGSMMKWMAGQGANVLAIDIDTRYVEEFATGGQERSDGGIGTGAIEVRRVDIRTDQLPQAEFDLVHARLVLEHLTDRRQILERLAATLRPGGWMVIEDYDWTSFGFEGTDPQMDRVVEAILGFMQNAGFEPRYGRLVVADIEGAGLTDVRGEGRARMIRSSDPGFDFFRLSFESIRGAVVEAGMISPDDAAAASARFGENMRVLTPVMMAGIGRRP
jgi:SAM-dependent methyltransferase